jgi:hypothetical protein
MRLLVIDVVDKSLRDEWNMHRLPVLTILPSQPQAQAPLPTAAVRRNRVRVPRGDDLGGRVCSGNQLKNDVAMILGDGRVPRKTGLDRIYFRSRG